MKILFLTDNFPPEVNAPATRTYEHCKQWVKLGVDVTVITCFPNFPLGKLFDGYKNRLYQKDEIDGIKIIRVWTYITKNKGFFKRSLDYFSFAVSSFIVGLFVKTDIIIATSPQFFTTWSGWALSKIKRKPWIFELRDLWPESIKAVGATKNERLIKFLEKIELRLYKSANRVVSVTDSFKQNLIKRGINDKKIEVIYNGANLDLFYPMPKSTNLVKRLDLQNKFVVGYIGTHGMAHGLDFILKSIKNLEKEFHFLFIGDGAEKENLLKLKDRLGLKNVTFLNPIKKEDVPKYLSVCDVSLVPLKKSDTFKTVIPSKIFESSAMQIPILLGVEGEVKSIIERYKAGVCFEPENKDDFLKSLHIIKEKHSLFLEGCRQLALNFDRKKLALKMLNILKEVANE